MQEPNSGQVQLLKLIFTVSWEDPASDYQALRIRPGDTMMSITSGACNTLGFLLKDPSIIHAVDINPSQSYLLELKMAAMRALEHPEFLRFTGIVASGDRHALYERVRSGLSPAAAEFWDYNHAIVDKGFLLAGKYDRFVSVVGTLIRAIHGRATVEGLLACDTVAGQQAFYERRWENWRTALIFNLFYNKVVLGRIGLKSDYFQFDDGSTSFSESFRRKYKRAVSTIPIAGNYFVHVYLDGHYRSLLALPEYLLEENYAVIRGRLDRIRIVTQDAKKWLAGLPDDAIDCFSLSNICELMNRDDTHETFLQVFRKARPGARICFRNLMIPRTVPDDLQAAIVRDDALSATLLRTDRSFVYSRVDAMTVAKW